MSRTFFVSRKKHFVSPTKTFVHKKKSASPARRPERPRNSFPRELMELVPRDFELDDPRFAKNLRSSKRGAAGGPSSMTAEHLRPLLDSPRDTLFAVRFLPIVGHCQSSARSQGHDDVGHPSHPCPTVGQGCGKFQSTFPVRPLDRSGVRMHLPHVAGAVRDEPEATIISEDGISAFDFVSRRAKQKRYRLFACFTVNLPHISGRARVGHIHSLLHDALSGCIAGRPRCGTAVGFGPRLVMRWNGWHVQ